MMMMSILSSTVIVLGLMSTEWVWSVKAILMCYYNSTARLRTPPAARFRVDDIDFNMCSHYIYAHGNLNGTEMTIKPLDAAAETGPGGLYRFTNGVKNYLYLQALLSIGGPGEAIHQAFLAISDQETTAQRFARNAVLYLQQHGFDGLDIDWQYPTNASIRSRLTLLLRALRAEFDSNIQSGKLTLTLKCKGLYDSSAYNVPAISQYVDYVIIAAYNLPQLSDHEAWFSSPLFSNASSVQGSVSGWHQQGLPSRQTVVGMTGIGRIYQLVNSSRFTPGSPVTNAVLTGPQYGIPSGLAYPEVCQLYQPVRRAYFDNTQFMNYFVSGDKWVGYENTGSFRMKVTYCNVWRVAGVMFAGLDEDDFTGLHCQQKSYPLVRYLRSIIPSFAIYTLTTRPGLAAGTTPTTAAMTGGMAAVTAVRSTNYASVPPQGPVSTGETDCSLDRTTQSNAKKPGNILHNILAYSWILLLVLCVLFVILLRVFRRKPRNNPTDGRE